MEKILVSSCLIGERVRYNGLILPFTHTAIDAWRKEGRLVPFCPEVASGLSVPRISMELKIANDGTKLLFTRDGQNVSKPLYKALVPVLEMIQKHSIRFALLKEKSPTCATKTIYDGTFTSNLIPGSGIFTDFLRAQNILCFNENEIDELSNLLR